MDQKPDWWDLQYELNDALRENDFDRAQQAIDQGADPNKIDEDDSNTPLFWAAFGDSGFEEIAARVEWILGAGALVALETTEHAQTSVHTAAESGNAEVLRLLLAADGKCALNRFDYIGRTPLICAVDKGHLESAKLLIEAGADVNAHDETHVENSALSWAVTNDDIEMVKLLLAAGADPTIRGWMQLNALDRAEKNPRILELLKDAAGHLEQPGSRDPEAGGQS